MKFSLLKPGYAYIMLCYAVKDYMLHVLLLHVTTVHVTAYTQLFMYTQLGCMS